MNIRECTNLSWSFNTIVFIKRKFQNCIILFILCTGTEVSRPYTPVPGYLNPEDRPNSIATNDDCICLMVKRYEEGTLSPLLTSLKVGDKIELSNTLGSFNVSEYDDCTKVHMISAGSGLTVMLSIIKRAFGRRDR